MATKSHPPAKEQEEETESLQLVNADEDTVCDDVQVSVAVVGKVGSGKSSFISVILGLNENDEKDLGGPDDIAKTKDLPEPAKGSDERPSSYFHPKNPKILFSIFTRASGGTKGKFDKYLDSIKPEKFDAFLIFTDEFFSKKNLAVAEKIRGEKKPFFFVRTKFDNQNHPEEFNKEELVTKLKESLMKNSEKPYFKDCEIHLISNMQPYKWDFLNLTRAIADSLPASKKTSFCKIPKIQELIALEKFHNFLKEVEVQRRNVTKILPSVDEIKQSFVQTGIVGVQRAMNEKLDRWKEVKVNLAILGNSGVGKSTFINALREVEDDDETLAATTGVVETTRAPTPFEHPTNPNIRFWDLPGIGTPNYKTLEIFCEKVAIETYDTFLIICSKRFTNNDLLLAEKVQSMRKSFFFVRTKIDNDIRGEKRKKTFNEEKMLKLLKEDCIENLKSFSHGAEKVFLVSSFSPNKWDFDRLKKAILDQLPSKQKESLSFSMRSYSEDMVKEKIEILRSRVWMVAAASVVSKFTLGPFSLLVDGKLIRDKVKFYSKQMEFPGSESEEFSTLSDDLQQRVKRFHPSPDQDICQWLKSFDHDNTFNIRKYGKLIMTKNPLMFVYRFLNHILVEMEETALAIFSEAAARSNDNNDESDSD